MVGGGGGPSPRAGGGGGAILGAACCSGDVVHPDSRLLIWQPGRDNLPAAAGPFRPQVATLRQGGPSPPVTQRVGIGVACRGHRVGTKGP